MGISAWSIRNPIPAAVLFIALWIAGLTGYKALPIKLLPDVSLPIVQVTVSLLGAAAVEVERQITREIEAAVSNVAGVDHVHSSISLGLSGSVVEFEIGIDAQKATEDVRAAIDRIRANLPAGIQEPIVERFDIDSQPIVTYAVTAPEMSDVELSWFVDDTVARRVIEQSGVAQIKRVGGVAREINVTLDPARLDALGLTAPQVNNALRGVSLDAGGGSASIGNREQTVRVLGAAESVEALRDISLPTGSGRTVRLGDVATVNSSAAERTGFALLGGTPVVAFQVMETKTVSDVAVETSVATAIAALTQANPGVSFKLIVSAAQNTKNSFDATVAAVIEGSADTGSGDITVVLKPKRSMTTQEFQTSIKPLLYQIPDVRLSFGQSGGGGSNTVQILLSSKNPELLARAALDVERQMRALPQLSNAHQNTPRPGADLVIRLKPVEAARLGVTADIVAAIARVATIGDIDANSVKFNTGEQRLPIRVRLPGQARADLVVLGALRVPTVPGGAVPLSAVAELSFQAGTSRIVRYDRERRVTIEAELNGV
jgi:multidrug efflux pump subunit AcrB